MTLASRATPTTSTGSVSSSRVTRAPTGSADGQKRRAIAWLTIATGGAPSRSAAVNSRPFSKGMPTARK